MSELPRFRSFLHWWVTVDTWLAVRGQPTLLWDEATYWWQHLQHIDDDMLNRITDARKAS